MSGFLQSLEQRVRQRGHAVIVVAEGAMEVGKSEIYQDRDTVRLGGVGEHIRRRVEAMTGKESRCVVLGHLQRGGSPNAFDRMLGTNFGACAVRALTEAGMVPQ